MEKNTGKNKSLISIGLQAFRVLDFLKKGCIVAKIKENFYLERNVESKEDQHKVNTFVNKIVSQLKEAGWIEENLKVNKSGDYFLKAIYQNKKIGSRLK